MSTESNMYHTTLAEKHLVSINIIANVSFYILNFELSSDIALKPKLISTLKLIASCPLPLITSKPNRYGV